MRSSITESAARNRRVFFSRDRLPRPSALSDSCRHPSRVESCKHQRNLTPNAYRQAPVNCRGETHHLRNLLGSNVEVRITAAFLDLRFHYASAFIEENPQKHVSTNAGVAQFARILCNELT